MSKNVIVIDIDTERDRQIIVSKPEEYLHQEGITQEELIRMDTGQLNLASMYLCSSLSEEGELKELNNMINVLTKRRDELDKTN